MSSNKNLVLINGPDIYLSSLNDVSPHSGLELDGLISSTNWFGINTYYSHTELPREVLAFCPKVHVGKLTIISRYVLLRSFSDYFELASSRRIKKYVPTFMINGKLFLDLSGFTRFLELMKIEELELQDLVLTAMIISVGSGRIQKMSRAGKTLV